MAFSVSPTSPFNRSDIETEKKFALHKVQIALAISVFPVPGGPYLYLFIYLFNYLFKF